MLTDKQKSELLNAIERMRILAWDHCETCHRSQGRFYIYYQEQFDRNHASCQDLKCLFCNADLDTYCEDGHIPYERAENWHVPTEQEFRQQVAALEKKFGVTLPFEKWVVK